jgi:hypothetical protein
VGFREVGADGLDVAGVVHYHQQPLDRVLIIVLDLRGDPVLHQPNDNSIVRQREWAVHVLDLWTKHAGDLQPTNGTGQADEMLGVSLARDLVRAQRQPYSEPFSSVGEFVVLEYVDGFGESAGAVGAASEFAQDAPGFELGVGAFAGAA